MQAVTSRTFGLIFRMENNRRRMKRTGRQGRPSREWLNDIRDWCQTDVHSLSLKAQDKETWKKMIKNALDTYRLCALGSELTCNN